MSHHEVAENLAVNMFPSLAIMTFLNLFRAIDHQLLAHTSAIRLFCGCENFQLHRDIAQNAKSRITSHSVSCFVFHILSQVKMIFKFFEANDHLMLDD